MSISILDSALIEDKVTSNASDVVLSVNHVSKKYSRHLKRAMLYALYDIGAELLGTRKRKRELRKQEFWAVQDVSFELKKGEAIGLVGANGAGKTTLLKIISGLIKPDQGSVTIKGRVAPLIALGAGFNPVLSGRENIFINMSILGLTKAEITEKFDEVVNFAEIGDAIDAPVQTYSSGMSARLGFSCAVHTNPDVLLIDEVLAVGDMRFRAKCYRKLAELRNSGASFLLVSHSAQSLLAVCNIGILLSKGRLISSNKIESILSEYEGSIAVEGSSAKSLMPNLESEVYIDKLETISDSQDCFFYSEKSKIRMTLFSRDSLSDLKIILVIRSVALENDYALFIDSSQNDFRLILQKGSNNIELILTPCGLKAGLYTMKIAIVGKNHYVYDAIESFNFSVKNTTKDLNSTFYQPISWLIK